MVVRHAEARVAAVTLVWMLGSAALGLEAELADRAQRYPLTTLEDGTVYVDLGKAAHAILGDAKGTTTPTLTELLTILAERVPEGGAIHLGNMGWIAEGRMPRLDLRRIKDNIVITGTGDVVLGGGQKGLQVLCGPSVEIQPAVAGRSGPLENLTMLYGNCTRISGDVKGSDFIAAVNGWASYAFKAEARVDDTLFLWFSRNWTFADYNAHLKNPDKEWWRQNCQAYFDLKGGGQGTRVYLMIETDYGNPGVGVWLKDCDGLAMYHGATERGSSQGPGCYYLQNCRNVQLGLRRIFPGSRGGGKAAMPTHAITVEGGSGNILHAFTDFANAYEVSMVNSDPRLQLWMASFDYETRGVETPDVLRFCYTPLNNLPQGKNAEDAARLAEREAANWVRQRNATSGQPDTPENVAALQALIRKGRDAWWPLNGTHEETFTFAGMDLTKGLAGVTGKLPPPPSIPATDAPKSFRPLYFAEQADFGEELLGFGADPSGKTPSDDAFAKAMFGMSAAEVVACYDAVVSRQDKEAYDRLFPPNPRNPKAVVRRPRLSVPAGTFLLDHTLLFGPGSGGLMGAGPDKTVLRFRGDIACLKQFNPCGFYNVAIEGGRTGLEVTGGDHNGPDGLLRKSYVAGDNYYNITFRNQTFAGIHVGTNDPDVMGGAEHDQNKYVNLRFLNTGGYGIYMNNGMLDKWLCLNGEFVGQRKAGVSINFNNLIHGGLFNCSFRDIDGPGLDFMGGNPELAFRPYIVMVDQCEFVECGNATHPALDYGYGEVMALLRTTIITKGKPINGGYIGSAQHVEDVTVDVNLVDGASAMTLRGVRNGQTARANGHILRNVTANGPVAFINDANVYNHRFRKTLAQRDPKRVHPDGTVELDWDTNASAHELAPPNGWVHPFLFYACTFGDKTYAYTLLNADTDHNRVLTEVDLSPLAR